ncbi:MAG: AMP-binding protein, partial [Oscillospiraceae bacterium]
MPISAEAPWLNYYGAIPRTLNYPRLTIYQLVAQTARECPDLPAYEFMGRRTSYRDFLARIDRAALALYTAGIRAGDRVTICMPNTPQALDCFYALNRIGAVSNMIHPLSAEEEIRFYLDVSGSQAILTLDRFYGKVAAAAARAKRKPKLWIARLQPELKPLMRLGYNLTQGRKTPKLPQEGCTLWTDLLRKAAGTLPPDDGQCDACASILYSGGT